MAIRITGMNSGLDTDSIIKDLVSAYDTKTDTLKKQKTKMEWKEEAWKELNTKIYDFYTNQLGNFRFASKYNQKKTTSTDTSKATVTASSSAVVGTQTLEVEQIAQTAYLTGSKVKAGSTLSSNLSNLGFYGTGTIDVKVGSTTKSIYLEGTDTIDTVITKLKDAGINASFDATNQRIFLSGKESGAEYDFSLTSDNDELLKSLGLLTKEQGGEAIKIDGQDSKIILNGATFTSNSNNYSINGLNITAISETNGNKVSLSTTMDAQGIYDSIKSFITEYNKLIKEIDKLYNADQAKKMEPLTDSEKDAMSDEEVEKWETKIKDSLLRRDDTLGSVANVLKNAMLKTYTINEKTYSLSSFGIGTGSYSLADKNEKSLLHINGDKDDSTSSSNADKLLEAINSDPDTVADFFSQLVKGAYSELDKKMKSTTLSSAYKVYNDKQMTTELTDMEKKISDWEEKVADIEEKYYKQFSAMETALGNLQSAQNALSGLLGTS